MTSVAKTVFYFMNPGQTLASTMALVTLGKVVICFEWRKNIAAPVLQLSPQMVMAMEWIAIPNSFMIVP
jgi:hypothetical protein